jgi:hypothetical protein
MEYAFAIVTVISIVAYTAVLFHYDRRKIIMHRKIPLIISSCWGVTLMIIMIADLGISSAPIILVGFLPIAGIYIAGNYFWYSSWRKTSLLKGYEDMNDKMVHGDS